MTKLLWTVLINVAVLLVIAAASVCYVLYYKSGESRQLFEPTLQGYRNHQLIQFTPTSDTEVRKLIELQNKLDLLPWSRVLRPGWPATFQVPPDQSKLLSMSTEALHMPFVLLSSNMEEYLVNRKRVATEFRLDKASDFDLNRYHFNTEIEKYLIKLADEQTGRLIVKPYGSSIEARTLYYVRIYKSIEEAAKSVEKPPEDEKKEVPPTGKKTVFIECGAHSREWLGPAVCLQIINSLVHDAESQPLLEQYEFYVLPLINPDGYAYTWVKDRLWRKNRRRFANNCYGVDLNRNFNIGFNTSEIQEHIHLFNSLDELDIWNKTLRRFKRLAENGTSSEPIQCNALFPGERSFSENETYYLKLLIDRMQSKPNVYISLHAYSRMWLYPFGIGITSPVDEKLQRYAKIGVENLRKANRLESGNDSTIPPEWKYGRAIDVMYNAGGISIDWAHKDVGIELVYTLEMRDSGKFGFLLPDDQIEPAFREVWSGLSAVLLAYAEDLDAADTEPPTTADRPAESTASSFDAP